MSENTDPITPTKISIVGLGFDQGVVGDDIGSRNEYKEHNEDNYWPHEKDRTKYEPIDYLIAGRLYLVADGVSGGLAGHEASELAVETIAERYYERMLELEQPATEDDLVYALKNAIMAANERLLGRSRELRRKRDISDKKSYLQTAVVCAVLRGTTLTIANVGDCHLYRYRSGQVALLYEPTQHSFVGTSLKRDKIEIRHEQIAEEDVLILGSDGLYKYLAPDNDPEKAPSEMKKIFKRYYESEGIKGVGDELLRQANDKLSGGGGDNITVMVLKPGGELDRVLDRVWENEFEKQIQPLWWLPMRSSGSQLSPALIQLGQLCRQKAKESSQRGDLKERQRWLRRAAQLGDETPGMTELAEARELYDQLGFEFKSNYEIVQKISRYYSKVPDNPELRKLTVDALLDLGNTALILRLEAKKVNDTCQIIKDNFSIFDEFEAKKAKKILSDLKELTGLGFHRDQDEVPDDTKAPPETTEVVPTNEQKDSLLDQHLKEIIIFICFLIPLLICALIFMVRPNVLSDLPLIAGPNAKTTSSVSDVQPSPTQTATAEASPTVLSANSEESPTVAPPSPTVAEATPTINLPTGTPIVPVVKMNESTYEMMETESARKQIKVITHLSIQDSSDLDTSVIIELETRLPQGLLATGSGSAEVEIKEEAASSETIVTQRVPLNNVDPMNVNFESIHIIDSPHSRESSYTIPVITRLFSAQGREIYRASKAIEVGPIAHEPALSITLSLSKRLVAINDTVSFDLSITNTGQTWLEELVFKPEKMPAELNVDANDWQSQLDGLGALEPGQTEQISLSAEVKTDEPGKLKTTVPIEGLLGDGTVVQASSVPVQLEIYAQGTTSAPAGYSEFHPLRELPGVGSNENPQTSQLPNGIEVKVLEAAEADDYVWYFLEVMRSDGQAISGWLWSERVELENR